MNDLSVLFGQPGSEISVEVGDEKALAAMMKTGDYLPRFTLYASSSKAVKQDKIQQGRFGIEKDKQITDLGKEVDVIVCAVRPCAIRILTAQNKVLSYYDYKSPQFQEIQVIAEGGDKKSGCLFGPQFLLWVPVAQEFVLYHMNNPTGRRAAPELKGLLKQAATIKSKLIESGGNSWHGPDIVPCSTPISVLPDKDEFDKQIEKFKNPKEATVEVDPDAQQADSGEQRAR